LVQIFDEPGRSAKNDLRPTFPRMMSQAEARRFDVIIVHKLDRFSRSLADVVRNVARLKEVDYLARIELPEDWRARVLQLSQLDDHQVESLHDRRRRLENQLERARKLYLLGDIEEGEIVRCEKT